VISMLEINKIHQGDCLEVMKDIGDNSVDMVLCDLPYGTTACNWDSIINLETLWKHYKRIIKRNGAIILTACQPFTSKLIMSNIKMFKYIWVWNKNRGGNFVHSKFQPLKVTEDIVIFGDFPITYTPKGGHNYNPQMEQGKPYSRGKINDVIWNGRKVKCGHIHNNKNGLRFPKNIININNSNNKSVHPTQKPIALFEYLIKTYSKEKDIVLDNCIGSGTTAIACQRTNRRFIGIELEKKYVEIAQKRLSQKSLLPLDTKQEGGNGVPPTLKSVGIPPKVL